MRFTEFISENEKPGLWANIHAKRDRIKHGSGERMRKPGSKGAPTADALRKSATDEAANPAQQAAIAINMKKHHQKPKDVAEGLPNADVKKQISKFEELALAANRAGDDVKCKQYQQKIQSLKQKMSQGVAEGSTDLVQIEYWQQETMESGRWVKTKPMPRATAEKIVNSFERGEIVDVEQGVAEGESTILSPGTQVTVPHKGKMVSGKIVRYDSGKGIESPAYIVDISEYESLIVPVSRVKQDMDEGENWSKHNNKRVGGMSKKSVSSYRRSHPGSKIQTAVTTKPSKLKKGSKAAKRRASFCARMRGMKKHRTGAKTARDPNSNINKSLRRWHCESIEELHELVMLAEQFIRNNKK
jgi:hypothetical protein